MKNGCEAIALEMQSNKIELLVPQQLLPIQQPQISVCLPCFN